MSFQTKVEIIRSYYSFIVKIKQLENLGYDQIEAVTRRCCVKKVLMKISQNLQENTCARVSFLIKLQASCNFLKKETLGKGIFL